MAITIRNKETEALIRALGKPRGEGPSATIARIAREAKAQQEAAGEADRGRRRRAMRSLLNELPKLTQDEKALVREDVRTLHDEDGLPR
jgi:hypothetical protein